ncbi:MAG: type II toxin-antitoxin system HipA family toxin [Turicibacter sp.]|nr:type II toxin-antitoxin system HipA family toxin [Turicibacter sp.]
MDNIRHLDVFYKTRKVGTLATHQKYFAAFEYDKEWLIDGFSISPFSLPLEKRVFIPKIDPLEGLYGVFSDSLPDGWGRLLVDRLMLANNLSPSTFGNLDRLAIVGTSGMGALSYRPEKHLLTKTDKKIDLDRIATECNTILTTEYSEQLDDLFLLGGSSGGARPKILTTIEGEEWIIKFPSQQDGIDIGLQEYEYARCAQECGIEMAEIRLFDSKKCAGYFGTKRFDRPLLTDGAVDRIHMVSVSGLLETTHRIPNLDYRILLKLTSQLTRNIQEVEKMYRLMCFNVFAHNRDDHSKNFAFLYDDVARQWHLSPAYDLTHSYSIGGEHATTVNGNGINPGQKEILTLAKSFGLEMRKAKQIADDVQECVNVRLGKYLKNKIKIT